MSQQAKVSSIDALRRFKIAFCQFAEEAKLALVQTKTDIRRFTDFLEIEMPNYWNAEVKRCEKELAEARSNLLRKQITAPKGEAESRATEQKIALQKAKERMELAERKRKLIKKWSQAAGQAINRYEGQGRQLGNLLEADVPHAINLLDRMLDALDKYVRGERGPEFSEVVSTAAPSETAKEMPGAEP